MTVSNDKIAIKKSVYASGLSNLLTKKKKKNWNEKFLKQNKSVLIPNLAEENFETNYAEIVWRNHAYWFCYTVSVPEKDISPYPFKVAGADLGEIHAVTAATDDKALRSEEHTSELQSRGHLVCRLLLEKNNHIIITTTENYQPIE